MTMSKQQAQLSRLGQRIVALTSKGYGALAEDVTARATEVVPIPDGLDYASATALYVACATVYDALVQRAGLRPGETLVVLGAAGGVGLAVVEMGKALGAEVIAVSRSRARSATAIEKGADHIINYSEDDVRECVLEITVQRLLLISSSEVGQRITQHRAVFEAAKSAGVQILAYTSLLHADKSTIGLAVEHRDTERALPESGLDYVLLRNGWYSENYTASVPSAIDHGVIIGSTQEGRISSAAREDYADAAAIVLTSEGQAGMVYELAADESYSLSKLASEIAIQSCKNVVYNDLPEDQYEKTLIGMGLPEGFAELLANSDAAGDKGDLFDESRQLSDLLGRPNYTHYSVRECCSQPLEIFHRQPLRRLHWRLRYWLDNGDACQQQVRRVTMTRKATQRLLRYRWATGLPFE